MKISYKKVTILFLTLVLIISGAVWIFIKIYKGNFGEELNTYKILVTVRDQKNADPEEDKRNSMKKGFVIGVYDKEHIWSQTERVSYLILKIELTDKQKEKIIKPIEKKTKQKKLSEEEKKMVEISGEDSKKEIIEIRKYKINLDEIGFDNPNILLERQPFENKVFNWRIVEKIAV